MEFAKKTFFGERIAHGMLSLCVGSALIFHLGPYVALPKSFIAFYGMDSVSFVEAAKIGDGINVYKDVCMAKNFATKVCDRVVYDAVQVHGGYGYCREYLVERLYRDSRFFSIGGGTYEIMNEVISKQMGL
ncbi:MAG: hypothetical protein KKH02_09135 [Proteobacteria bacterium]|nr:hypothetical protein [Pseudomonadota bacterium]